METTTVEARVKRVIGEQLSIPIAKIEDTSTFADFKMDSLTLIELMLRLEEEFGVSISEDDGRALKDVREAVRYFERKLS